MAIFDGWLGIAIRIEYFLFALNNKLQDKVDNSSFKANAQTFST